MLVTLRLVPIVRDLLQIRQSAIASTASLERFVQRQQELLLAAEQDTGTRDILPIRRGIVFQNVNFSYADAPRPALTDVTLTFPAGQMTALVGPSGGGKSTLIDLIPRLRVGSSGSINIDGLALQDIRLASLRGQIAYAPQTPQMFDVSVAEHIRYGNPSATHDEIAAAARLAAAADFISELSCGYDTRIGDGGSLLSGGQRQRLDLARAIAKPASILIMDEPSSALDADSEMLLREALKRIRDETAKCIIIIGHRLSLVTGADQIVVLRDGRVQDVGTHADLMARGGWYAQAYRKQHLDHGLRDERILASRA
jgi:ABC-type multidrug transport system fused ATPase/permease subunit